MWSGILGLSVVTDLLFVPVALSLYLALKEITRNAMLVATAFVGLFVVLGLAVTWSNYASLIVLSGDCASRTRRSGRPTSGLQVTRPRSCRRRSNASTPS